MSEGHLMVSPSRLKLSSRKTDVSEFSAVVMVAWYTTSLTKHFSIQRAFVWFSTVAGFGGCIIFRLRFLS